MKCEFGVPASFTEARERLLTLVYVSSYRYNFKSDPRNVGAVVILSADESTYTG